MPKKKWEDRSPPEQTMLQGCAWILVYTAAIGVTLVALFIADWILNIT